MKADKKQIQNLLSRNVEEVIDKEHLTKALQSGKKLRVKLGIDPTSPHLHLGHAVVLWKLREFQDLGHTAVLIVGDFTAQIGDPSGKTRTRPPMTSAEIQKNMRDYVEQASKILDPKKIEIHYNSEWFASEGIDSIVRLTSAGSMQQILRRADFKKRLSAKQDVTLLEVLYPLLQGYDSVKISADVELGGTDQLFNVLMGRQVQRHYGMKEQDILTVPLLEGLDGVRKMSKSLNNYIALTEAPEEMYGKIMAIPDPLIIRYFWLATDLPEEEIKKFEQALKNRKTNPKEVKSKLAFEVVSRYYKRKAAEKAAERFEKMFSKGELEGELPFLTLKAADAAEKVPEFGAVKMTAVDIVLASGQVKSKSEARRLISQGGFSVNNSPRKNPAELISTRTGDAVKIGKRHFFRVKVE